MPPLFDISLLSSPPRPPSFQVHLNRKARKSSENNRQKISVEATIETDHSSTSIFSPINDNVNPSEINLASILSDSLSLSHKSDTPAEDTDSDDSNSALDRLMGSGSESSFRDGRRRNVSLDDVRDISRRLEQQSDNHIIVEEEEADHTTNEHFCNLELRGKPSSISTIEELSSKVKHDIQQQEGQENEVIRSLKPKVQIVFVNCYILHNYLCLEDWERR